MVTHISIGTEGVTISVCGEEFKVPLDQLDKFTFRDLGRFVSKRWKEHEERELERKYAINKELLDFGRSE